MLGLTFFHLLFAIFTADQVESGKHILWRIYLYQIAINVGSIWRNSSSMLVPSAGLDNYIFVSLVLILNWFWVPHLWDWIFCHLRQGLSIFLGMGVELDQLVHLKFCVCSSLFSHGFVVGEQFISCHHRQFWVLFWEVMR